VKRLLKSGVSAAIAFFVFEKLFLFLANLVRPGQEHQNRAFTEWLFKQIARLSTVAAVHVYALQFGTFGTMVYFVAALKCCVGVLLGFAALTVLLHATGWWSPLNDCNAQLDAWIARSAHAIRPPPPPTPEAVLAGIQAQVNADVMELKAQIQHEYKDGHGAGIVAHVDRPVTPAGYFATGFCTELRCRREATVAFLHSSPGLWAAVFESVGVAHFVFCAGHARDYVVKFLSVKKALPCPFPECNVEIATWGQASDAPGGPVRDKIKWNRRCSMIELENNIPVEHHRHFLGTCDNVPCQRGAKTLSYVRAGSVAPVMDRCEVCAHKEPKYCYKSIASPRPESDLPHAV